METVKFASYINSEVFSFNVGWIPESQFLTIVCYYPINPKKSAFTESAYFQR